MDVTQAVPEDELLLARLATTKLANMLGGVMSTGAAALELPGPEAFFAGRDATLLAFVKVLECVGVKPGCDDAYTSLRAKAENLSHLTITFFKQYVDLCKWPTLSEEEIDVAADNLVKAYIELCRSLSAFRAQLGVDCDCSRQIDIARAVGAFIKTLKNSAPTRQEAAAV